MLYLTPSGPRTYPSIVLVSSPTTHTLIHPHRSLGFFLSFFLFLFTFNPDPEQAEAIRFAQMLFRDVVGRRCYILAGFPTTTPTSPATPAAIASTLIYTYSSTVRLRTSARLLLSTFPPSSLTHSSSSSSRLHTLATSTRTLRISKKNLFKLASAQQQRDHIGHSHSHSHGHGGHHHHHHDNTYLVSKNKTDAGVRITRIGLYVNLMMAVSKGIGGWYFNSQALVCFPSSSFARGRD